MNLRKQLIFLTLLVLLVGVVNATELGDTTSTDDVSSKTMHKTSTVSSTNIVKENTNLYYNLKSNKQNNKTIKENTTNINEKDNNKDVSSDASSAKEDATNTFEENIQNNTSALALNNNNTKFTSDQSNNTIDSLDATNTKSIDNLNNINEEIDSLNKKNNVLVKEWSLIDSITENLNKLSEKLSSNLKNSDSAIVNTMKNIIGSLNESSTNFTKEINNIRSKINSISTDDENIKKQIENAKKVLNNLTEFNNQFAEKLQEYNDKIPEISQNIISTLDNTNKNLTEKLNDLLKNGVDLPEELINGINYFNSTINDLLQNGIELPKEISDGMSKLNNTINDFIKNGIELPKEINDVVSKLNNTFNNLISKIGNNTKDNFNITDIIKKLNNTNFTDLIKNAESELQKIGEFINNLFNKPTNTTITINPVKANVGSITKLSANILDKKGNKVNEGRIFFKVNGVTLKDKGNNVLYGIVSNGTASINYKVQDAWVKNTTYIEAIYGGSDKYASSRTNSTQALNIGKGTAKLTLQNPSITAKSGDSITLTARVNDANGDGINTGKIIFKLNGKTITDGEGKTLFAKVVNGEAVLNFVIPTKYTAKKYTITAVYGGDYYERTEAKGTLTLEKKGVTINSDGVLAVKGKISVKASITDESGKLLVTSTKLTIKINGKTALSNVNSTNGIIDVSFTTTLRPGMYELLIISGENGIYKTGRMTTVLYVAD